MRFSLDIEFRDRTRLIFDINPEPLVLPINLSAGYVGWRMGETPSAQKLGRFGHEYWQPASFWLSALVT